MLCCALRLVLPAELNIKYRQEVPLSLRLSGRDRIEAGQDKASSMTTINLINILRTRLVPLPRPPRRTRGNRHGPRYRRLTHSTRGAPCAHAGTCEARAGCASFLVLDKHVQMIPWESLPILRGHSISHVPSVAFITDRMVLARLQKGLPFDGELSSADEGEETVRVDCPVFFSVTSPFGLAPMIFIQCLRGPKLFLLFKNGKGLCCAAFLSEPQAFRSHK